MTLMDDELDVFLTEDEDGHELEMAGYALTEARSKQQSGDAVVAGPA